MHCINSDARYKTSASINADTLSLCLREKEARMLKATAKGLASNTPSLTGYEKPHLNRLRKLVHNPLQFLDGTSDVVQSS